MLKTFRITSIKMLKIETQIKFINIYLNKLQTKTRLKITMNGFKQKFEITCEKIRQKLKINKERRRQTGNTSGKIKHKWINNIIFLSTQLMNRGETSTALWLCNAAHIDQQNEKMNAVWLIKKQTKKLKSLFKHKWKNKWSVYQKQAQRSETTASKGELGLKRLKRYKKLTKFVNALIIQIRSEKIELTNFLFRRRVYDVETKVCECDFFK